ncbi:MAG: cold shock domain-containing protein, partial [Actinomycetota bacterium]
MFVHFSAIQGEGYRNLEGNQKIEFDVPRARGPSGGERAPGSVPTGRLCRGPAPNVAGPRFGISVPGGGPSKG